MIKNFFLRGTLTLLACAAASSIPCRVIVKIIFEFLRVILLMHFRSQFNTSVICFSKKFFVNVYEMVLELPPDDAL